MRHVGVSVFILVLCSGVACGPRQISQLAVDVPFMPIVADGDSRIILFVRTEGGRVLKPWDVSARILEQDGRGRVIGIASRADKQMAIEFIPGVNPGRLTLELSGPALRPSRVTLNTVLANGDYYQDGTPTFPALPLPGSQHFAIGSPCWPNTRRSQQTGCPPRSIMRRCSALRLSRGDAPSRLHLGLRLESRRIASRIDMQSIPTLTLRSGRAFSA